MYVDVFLLSGALGTCYCAVSWSVLSLVGLSLSLCLSVVCIISHLYQSSVQVCGAIVF